MADYFFDESRVNTLMNAKDADPAALGEAIDEIYRKYGEIKPERLIEEAKDALHPAHSHFEWDDAKAAHGFRLEQARRIIRIVATTDPRSQRMVPAFVSLRSEGGTSYHPMIDVIRSDDLTDRLLKQAEADLQSFEFRYRRFEEFVSDVRSVREKIADRRGRRGKKDKTAEERPPA